METTVTPPNLVPVRETEGGPPYTFDPDVYHRSHFADGEYRVTGTHNGNLDTGLWKTSDILDQSAYDLTDESIFDSGSDDYRFNDHCVPPDVGSRSTSLLTTLIRPTCGSGRTSRTGPESERC